MLYMCVLGWVILVVLTVIVIAIYSMLNKDDRNKVHNYRRRRKNKRSL